MSIKIQDQYVDLKNDGRLFPVWVLHNFKKYKLPKIFRVPGEDPCRKSDVNEKLELRKYQEFIGQYLNPHGPYNEILLYHGLGSGKTATSINLLNILYAYNHSINMIILIKASLRDDPWMKDLNVWLGRDPSEENAESVNKLVRFQNIHFIHYDSPFADSSFIELMKKIDTSKQTIYVIDEVHNFIRNVYSNIKNKGKRAQVIYDYIIKDRKENKNNKLVLISATPGINTPYELALMFNMLRENTFPGSEAEFIRMFITDSMYPILSPQKKNLFQRRIMGLVSYYIGSTPDLFAKQELENVNLEMSDQQYIVYRVFEELENKIQTKARRFGKSSQLYRTYTRQACNFVFPYINSKINGETRPRPNAFRISEKLAQDLLKGAITLADKFGTESDKEINSEDTEYLHKYMKELEYFVSETEKYFMKINESDLEIGHTLRMDVDEFISGFDSKYDGSFKKFYENPEKKSKLFTALYDSSPKMLAIVFLVAVSPGKAMIYTNYVIMEGIDMLKVYFRLIGFNDYTIAKHNMGYCEYHGRMDKNTRLRVKDFFNNVDNIRGNKCKVILLSPSATEGIQLYGIRQEHLLEPYFTEVRMVQVIGRGLRMCSHVDLPMEDRTLKVYRYKVVKPSVLDETDTNRATTDEIIEDLAKAKDNLIQSFLTPMKEVAVDCSLFSEHNMMTQSYNCFKFPEDTLMQKHIGPAYKEDIKDDIKYDSGLHAKNTRVERIKVIKIQAVYDLNRNTSLPPSYSKPEKYWYYQQSGMIYDLETHYPIGQIQITDGLPAKIDKDTYIITDIIPIPEINKTKNL